MNFKEEIKNALNSFGGSKIIDSYNKNEFSYREILVEINKLKRSVNFDFKNKIVVFDFYENSIDLIILLLFVIDQEGIPLITEASGSSSHLIEKLPYVAIVKHKKSLLTIENDVELTRYDTTYGSFFIKLQLLNFSSYEDCTLLLTSSGTVGNKKIIKCSSEGIIANIKSNIDSLGIESKDTTLICLPIYYSYSLVAQFFSHLLKGANIIISPYRFVSLYLSQILNEYKPTNLFTTPTLVRILSGYKLKTTIFSLRFIAIGGGYLSKKCFVKFTRLYPCKFYYKTYGITEAGPRVSTYIISYDDVDSFEPNYIGKPINNVNLILGGKVSNHNSYNLNYLNIISPSVFRGYITNETETQYSSEILRTEDIVYENLNGIYIMGRKSDIHNIGFGNIWSFQIEDILFEQFNGLLKINFNKIQDKICVGIMKHPKNDFELSKASDLLKKKFNNNIMKNIIIENYNAQSVFSK